jgi:hypothetical protein
MERELAVLTDTNPSIGDRYSHPRPARASDTKEDLLTFGRELDGIIQKPIEHQAYVVTMKGHQPSTIVHLMNYRETLSLKRLSVIIKVPIHD